MQNRKNACGSQKRINLSKERAPQKGFLSLPAGALHTVFPSTIVRAQHASIVRLRE